MKASEIREKFINFFKDKDHSVVPSSPIVAKNDPSLMFTNAGMNPVSYTHLTLPTRLLV